MVGTLIVATILATTMSSFAIFSVDPFIKIMNHIDMIFRLIICYDKQAKLASGYYFLFRL